MVQAGAFDQDRRLRPVVHAQPAQKGGDMRLDGRFGERKL